MTTEQWEMLLYYRVVYTLPCLILIGSAVVNAELFRRCATAAAHAKTCGEQDRLNLRSSIHFFFVLVSAIILIPAMGSALEVYLAPSAAIRRWEKQSDLPKPCAEEESPP